MSVFVVTAVICESFGKGYGADDFECGLELTVGLVKEVVRYASVGRVEDIIFVSYPGGIGVAVFVE